MKTRHHGNWTIDHWRVEPRVSGLEFEDSPVADYAPAFWKDLTLASILALLFWIAAAAIFS